MHTKTITQLSALLQSRQISATELAQLFIKRIEASALNAFTHVDPALTLEQAAFSAEDFDGAGGPYSCRTEFQ